MSLIDYIQQRTQIEKEPLEALDAIFQVREYKNTVSYSRKAVPHRKFSL